MIWFTRIPKPNPKPNPYPFLDPGRVIPGIAGGPGPGIAGGPGPGRRAHPETQTHWGGYAPPDPPSGFFGTGGVKYIFMQPPGCMKICLAFFMQPPGCMKICLVFSLTS